MPTQELQFNDTARRALNAAAAVARSYGHGAVDGRHLMVALLHSDFCFRSLTGIREMSEVLPSNLIERLIHALKASAADTSTEGELPYHWSVEEAMSRARQEASSSEDRLVGVEHLLIALVEGGFEDGLVGRCADYVAVKQRWLRNRPPRPMVPPLGMDTGTLFLPTGPIAIVQG